MMLHVKSRRLNIHDGNYVGFRRPDNDATALNSISGYNIYTWQWSSNDFNTDLNYQNWVTLGFASIFRWSDDVLCSFGGDASLDNYAVVCATVLPKVDGYKYATTSNPYSLETYNLPIGDHRYCVAGRFDHISDVGSNYSCTDTTPANRIAYFTMQNGTNRCQPYLKKSITPA